MRVFFIRRRKPGRPSGSDLSQSKLFPDKLTTPWFRHTKEAISLTVWRRSSSKISLTARMFSSTSLRMPAHRGSYFPPFCVLQKNFYTTRTVGFSWEFQPRIARINVLSSEGFTSSRGKNCNNPLRNGRRNYLFTHSFDIDWISSECGSGVGRPRQFVEKIQSLNDNAWYPNSHLRIQYILVLKTP